LPAFDVRENAVLGFWPSWRQASAVSKDAYYLMHGAIMAIPWPDAIPKDLVTTIDYVLIAAADYETTNIPMMTGWTHEEGHRTVMSQYGIHSHNDMNDFPIGRSLVSVSHETDEDFIRLKRDHPADQVRMSAAGIETDFQQQIEFDKDRFYYRTRGATLFIEWLATTNAIFYMLTAATSSSVRQTASLEREEGTRVSVRDFTGLDPDGWVYDLFRPNEPYEARGVHPSGVGIRRYRTTRDLTPREFRYLRNTAVLSWLNLADPQLVGLYELPGGHVGGEAVKWNASANSVMTPFGYTIGLNVFAKAGNFRPFVGLHSYMSEALALPGIEAELVRYPLHWANASITPRVRFWVQPRHQLFHEHSATPGGALEARLNVPLAKGLEIYAEGAGKTPGWIQGDTFLKADLNVRTGVEALVF
jgi:hypothetical protein